MVIFIKKLVVFLVILFSFLIPSWLFSSNVSYYESLNLPWFAPEPKVFSIWFIIYILISYVVSSVITNSEEDLKDFITVYLVNYIMNILFTPLFFGLKSPLLGFIISFSTFITAIFLFIETRKLDKNLSWYLIPYIVWTLFASILSFSIFLLN